MASLPDDSRAASQLRRKMAVRDEVARRLGRHVGTTGHLPVLSVEAWEQLLGIESPEARKDAERLFNHQAVFHPYKLEDDGETEALPAVEVAGVLVFAYVKDGYLRVSIDLDTVDPKLHDNAKRLVPIMVKCQEDTIWATGPDGTPPDVTWLGEDGTVEQRPVAQPDLMGLAVTLIKSTSVQESSSRQYAEHLVRINAIAEVVAHALRRPYDKVRQEIVTAVEADARTVSQASVELGTAQRLYHQRAAEEASGRIREVSDAEIIANRHRDPLWPLRGVCAVSGCLHPHHRSADGWHAVGVDFDCQDGHYAAGQVHTLDCYPVHRVAHDDWDGPHARIDSCGGPATMGGFS